jgi:hypothetical protein
LADFAVLGTGKEKVRRSFRDDAFDSVCMRFEDLSFVIVECEARSATFTGWLASVLDVKNADLGISGAGDEGLVVGVWHEFD